MSLPAADDEAPTGMSVEVLVRVLPGARRRSDREAVIRTGRYLFGLEQWMVSGFSHPRVLEWWPLPTPGTGTKP